MPAPPPCPGSHAGEELPIDPDLHAAAGSLADRLASPATTRAGHPQSLSRGAVGIALLHIERAAQGLAGWDIAQAWLAAAIRTGVGVGPDATPYLGAPAIAFALHGAAHHGHCHNARTTLDHALAAIIRRRLDQAHARIDRGDRPEPSEFDAINGLAGFGANLLRHDPCGDQLPRVLAYLARLTEPLSDRDGLPGWWTDQPPTGRRATTAPSGGHSNHGMAHGISGCLARMALARRRGISVSGQDAAIRRICGWLDTWAQHHPYGPWWPEILTLDDLRDSTPCQTRPARPSWCYGTPGLARAQQLAGLALGDPARRLLAEQALLGCLADPRQRSLITDAGLCHGAAGLFQTTWRMAADSPHTRLSGELPQLAALLGAASPGEDPGALNGTAGLALAQTTAGTDQAATAWDTFLLLD